MNRESAIHPTAAEGFARGAETYAGGRPDFPPAVGEWLRGALRLGPQKTVLELGAGSGKFTARLLETGADVFALDPVAEMLEQLSRNARGATPILASAERIPLTDAAVDAVVCAQSFHWFATSTALAEMRRVLKSRGMLGLIWNVRDQSVEWNAKLTPLLAPYEGDTPRYDHSEWRKPFLADGFGPFQEQRFPHGHTGPAERVIVDRVASISFIAAFEPAEREPYCPNIRTTHDGHAPIAW